MTEQYSLVDTAPEPPYPPEVSAKGWRLELDVDRLRKSDTWALAQVSGPAYRPWLLMLWVTAWDQDPCGTFPNDDQLIAVRIGLDLATFASMRHILMRGWRLHADGRLYHDTLTAVVLSMLEAREKERTRKARNRAKAAAEQVETLSRGTDGGLAGKSRGTAEIRAGTTSNSDAGSHSPQDEHANEPASKTKSRAKSLSGQEKNMSRGTDTGLPPDSTRSHGTGTGTSNRNTESAATPLVSLSDLVKAGVNELHASSWLHARKAKKAPLTAAAWQRVLSQADKAGLTPPQAVQLAAEKGWAGFEASWLTEDRSHQSRGRPAGHPQETIGTPGYEESQAILAGLSVKGTPAPAELRNRTRRTAQEDAA